jgi:hypothetical protein
MGQAEKDSHEPNFPQKRLMVHGNEADMGDNAAQ